jgi:uncharacterized membrane protein YbaN (DUF454 family)
VLKKSLLQKQAYLTLGFVALLLGVIGIPMPVLKLDTCNE